MRITKSNKGFTLVEMLMAIVLSAGVMMTTTAFFLPSLTQFQASTDANQLRLNVMHPLETIGNDVEASRAIYVDGTLCYATCMVDKAGANRIYYYWGTGTEANTLYRKSEPIANTIACTGGTAVAQGLNKAETSFAMQKDLLQVNLAATGSVNAIYRVHSSFFPTIQERDIILSEGFECNTLNDGWVVTPGAGGGAWSVSPSVQNMGSYEISDQEFIGGTQTTSIEIALDISRLTAAHLSFRYMNSGTITAADSFEAFLFDGTNWQPVFSDASHAAINYSKPVKVDLSPYALNTSNKIRFTSTLSTAGAKWYVDQIQVYTP
jgi:prepilin-type N-terminal cleavage/methylation domain-containing protein